MRTAAREVLETVLDPGSFLGWAETGGAVLIGEGRVAGTRIALLISDFDVLAGSIGVAESGDIVDALARATRERLPVVAAPSSGGTRMQEGVVAFVQMGAIARAIGIHRAANLPYIVWLRDPTFGGVFASWGSLGQITSAEPEAALGFLGPRVYQALTHRSFPAGVQESSNLVSHGLIDAVVPLSSLRSWIVSLLAVLCPEAGVKLGILPRDPAMMQLNVSAWDSVVLTQRDDRPGIRDVLRLADVEFVELKGTGRGETSQSILLAVACFGSASCVLVAQDRRAQRNGHLIGPSALRVARRGIELSKQLALPLVTVVDTIGADLSPDAEEGGLSKEIASCLEEISLLQQPSLCVILGEGTGGAALALAATTRVIAARHGWLAPLPLAGASEIQYRTVERAAEVAEQQGISVQPLTTAGIVHDVFDERPDAADEPEAFAKRVVAYVERELATTDQRSPLDIADFDAAIGA